MHTHASIVRDWTACQCRVVVVLRVPAAVSQKSLDFPANFRVNKDPPERLSSQDVSEAREWRERWWKMAFIPEPASILPMFQASLGVPSSTWPPAPVGIPRTNMEAGLLIRLRRGRLYLRRPRSFIPEHKTASSSACLAGKTNSPRRQQEPVLLFIFTF